MLILLILLGLLPVTAPPVHDYHVSKTNVRYVTAKEMVQVEMHLFVDDLELDLAAMGAPERLEIGTKVEQEAAREYLRRYLDKHFRIALDGEEVPLELAGYELADDLHGLWIYLFASDQARPAAVTVENTLITGVYPDQKNIVKVFLDEARSATLLMSKDRPTAEHTF